MKTTRSVYEAQATSEASPRRLDQQHALAQFARHRFAVLHGEQARPLARGSEHHPQHQGTQYQDLDVAAHQNISHVLPEPLRQTAITPLPLALLKAALALPPLMTAPEGP